MLKTLRRFKKHFSVLMIVLLTLSNFAPMVSAEENQPADDQNIQVTTEGAVDINVDNQPSDQATEQSEPEAVQPELQPEFTGTLLKGTDPLANITFSIESTNGTWYDFTTDANGVFHYNLPDGDYKLSGVWADPTWYPLNQTFTFQNGLVNGEEWVINVLGTQPPDDEQGQSNVVGTLLKGTNNLANVTFSIHSQDGVNWYDTTTDANGKFGFNLPDGSYQIDGIWVDAEGKWYPLTQSFTVANGKLDGATELVINVKPVVEGANVTGVLTKGSEGLGNVTFSIESLSDGTWYDTTTDADGKISLTLPDGNYKLAGVWIDSESKWYEIQKTFTVEGSYQLNINLEGFITGTLLNGIDPVSKTTFSIHKTDEDIWYDVKTDIFGHFNFQLPDGSYQLEGIWVVEESKWYPLSLTFTVVDGALADGSAALEINIAPPVTDYNVTGQLKKGSQVLPNVLFSVHSSTGDWYDTQTDANGNYGFNLPDGSYVLDGVWVDAEGTWYDLKKEFTVSGELQLDIDVLGDIVEPPVGNVTGQLLKGTAPVANVGFSIYSTTGEEKWYDTKTDANGNFSFNLPDGSYMLGGVWVDAEGKWYQLNYEFTVAATAELTINLAPVEPDYNVTGQLVKGTQAIPNTWFSVHTVSGEELWYSAQTDANGNFGFTLPNGSYQVDGVWVDAEQKWYPLETQFTVDGELEITIDINNPPPPPTYNVTGILTNDKNPVANTGLSAHTTSGEELWYDATTDANGQFGFYLPDGDYQIDGVWVEAEFKWYDKAVQFAVENGKLVGSEQLLIDLAPTTPPPTDVTVVNGVVKDSDGPLSGIKVVIIEEGSENQYFPTTDENGQFTQELPNGNYVIVNVNNEEFDALVSKAFTVQDGKVLVSDQEVTSLEVSLPAVSVTGTLTNHGEAIAEGIVVVKHEGSDMFVAFTNEEGHFSLRLADGSYTLGNIHYDGNTIDASKIKFDVADGSSAALAIELDDLTTTPPTGNVTGVVQDENGPLQHAEVYIENVNNDDWHTATTDEEGKFVLELEDGEYELVYVKPENSSEVFVNDAFVVQDGKLFVNGNEVSQLVVTMPKVTIQGTVTDNGKAVANAAVELWTDREDGNVFVTETDANGKFSYRFADGDYYLAGVENEELGYVMLNMKFKVENGKMYVNGIEKSSLDLKIPSEVLKVKVTDGTNPIANAYFEFYGATSNIHYWVKLNENGEISARVADGDYQIITVYDQGNNYNVDYAVSIKDGKLYVNNAPSDQLVITLPVLNFKAQVVSEGKALSDVWVYYEKTENDQTTQFISKTDANGFIQARLSDGSYVVTGLNIDGEFVHLNVAIEIVNGKVLRNGEEVDVLTLTVPGASFKGQVLEEDGTPVAGAKVMVIELNNRYGYSFWTDPTGHFKGNLPNGDYKVTEVDGGPSDLVFSIQDGAIVVNDEVQDQLTLTVPPITVTGHVFETGGLPLPGSSVGVIDENHKNFNVETNQNGEFHLRIQDGKYTLTYVSNKSQSSFNLPFELNNGVLTVNGEVKSSLEVTLPKVSVVGKVYDENGQLFMDWVRLNIKEDKTGPSNYYYATAYDGEFSLRLNDGNYKVTNINTDQGQMTTNINFSVVNGKLVIDGQSKNSLDLHLQAMNIVGQLQDENGNPVVDANIMINSMTESGHYSSYTDQNGNFKLSLPDGSYRVSDIYIMDKTIRMDVQFEVLDGKLVIDGQEKDQLILKLAPVTVKGQVLDGSGVPLNGHANMFVNSTTSSSSTIVSLDSAGKFEMRLPDGEYRIDQIHKSDEDKWYNNLNIVFSVINGKLVVNGVGKESLTIQLPKVYTIQGHLEEAGQPLANMSVTWSKKDSNNFYTIRANENGDFTLSIENGEYVIHYVEANGNSISVNLAFKVVDGKLFVNEVESTQLLISLASPSVVGQVTDGAGPVKGVRVEVNKVEDGIDKYYASATTDADGHYGFRLPDGDYKISKIFADGVQYTQNLSVKVENGLMYVGTEKKDSIDFTIPSVTLTGTLYDGANIVPNVYLEIYYQKDASTSAYFSIKTDANGHFAGRFQDGTYTIQSVSNGSIGRIPLDVTFNIQDGKIIQDGNELTSLDIHIPSITLNGKLVHHGEPLADVYISLEDKANNKWYGIHTNSQGEFQFRLPDGEYFLDGISTPEFGYVKLNRTIVVSNGTTTPNPFVIEISDPVPVSGNVQGVIMDGNSAIKNSGWIYIAKKDDTSGYEAEINTNGEFGFELQDGNYVIKSVNGPELGTIKLNIEFKVQDQKMYVNDTLVNKLNVQIPAITVPGQVVDGVAPVGKIRVEVVGITDSSTTTGPATDNWYSLSTDENGNFGFRLPDGDYKVASVYPDATVGMNRLYPGNVFKVENGKLFVNGEQSAKLTITIPPVNLKGTLLEGETAVGNATIYLKKSMSETTYDYVYVNVKEDGKYAVRLEDGNYLIQSVWKNSDSREIPINKSFTVTNGKIVVDGAEVTKLDVSIPSVITLLKLMNGDYPLTNVNISLTERLTDQWISGVTDNNGELQLRVPDGIYYIDDIYVDGIGYKEIRKTIEVKDGQTNPSPYVLDFNENPTYYTINGILKDQEVSLPDTTIEIVDTENGELRTFVTDQEGHFTVELMDGLYNVNRIMNQSIGDINVNWPQQFIIANGKILENEQYVDQVVITIPPVSGTGKVVDGEFVIPHASIEIFNETLRFWTSVEADNEGNFELRLPDGDYSIRQVFADGIAYIEMNRTFTIKDGAASEQPILIDINAPIVNKGNIHGVVKDSTSTIRFTDIYIRSTDNWDTYSVQSNSLGEFQLDLPDGDYYVEEMYNRQFGYLEVNINFSVIDGKVYMNNEPQEQLELVVMDPNVVGQITDGVAPVGLFEVGIMGDYEGFNYVTDRNGNFKIRLKDGTYRLNRIAPVNDEFSQSIYQNIEIVIENGKMFVNGEEKDRLDISIQPVSFKGKLVDDAGKSMPYTGIQLKFPVVEDGYTYNETKYIYTNEDGEFEARLTDNEYTVIAINHDGFAVALLNEKYVIQNGKTLKDNQPVDSVVLNLPAVSIKGQLLKNGEPVKKANLSITRVEVDNSEYYNARTDAEGNFSLRFPDGEYIIDGYYDEYWNYTPLNRKIIVENGTSTPSPYIIEATDPIPVYGNLIGTVLDGDQTVGNATLYIYNVDTYEGYYPSTNSEGRFGLDLEDGEYMIDYIYDSNYNYFYIDKSFTVQDGKVYVDGNLSDELTVQLQEIVTN